MLTQQHYFASRFIKCDHKPDYRLHMCGLCHALGDGYGLFARLLTNHEMILLNTLTSAQQSAEPVQVTRRCPLNPARKVQTNQDSASQFAAAAAVSLAYTSVEDDRVDEGGIKAWAAARWLRPLYQKALDSLHACQFDPHTLQRLTAEQSKSENGGDPTRPTALLSAQLFAQTAQLADQPGNAAALATIGANYGAYLYLLDAYRDYPRDMLHDQYNPLRTYTERTGEGFLLAQSGIDWLRDQFMTIQQQIADQFAALRLYRYQDMLHTLLFQPMQTIIAELAQPRDRWLVRHTSAATALKAGLFLEEGDLNPAPRRRRAQQTSCTDSCDGDEFACDENTTHLCNPMGWLTCGDFGSSAFHTLTACFTPGNVECHPTECLPGSLDCNPCDNISACDNVDCGGADCGSGCST